MSTDDQPRNGPPAPFARRPVTWGRAPTTVFRAGPLPSGERLPPLPEPPKAAPERSSGPGILSGSLIPQAAPAPRPAEPPTFTETPARPAPPRSAPPRPAQPRPEAVGSDLTVRPLPAPEPEPEPRPALPREPVPASAEPVVAVSPALASASARRRPSGRAPLYAGVAAVVIGAVAVGGWLLTRPPAAAPDNAPATALVAETTAPAPAPAVVESAPPVEAVPVSADAASPEPAAPAPVRPAPERASATAPAPARPTPAPAAPPAVTLQPAPPVSEPPAPRIEIVPSAPTGPAPTSAERPPSDPDAPIATRPQPLEAGD